MTTAAGQSTRFTAAVMQAVRKYWGYDELRPLQLEAMEAGVKREDSLVVLPTGGGKSLCYAVPPLVANRMDIVVSPLISLMKDQVDALTACGYPAAALHSGLGDAERRAVEVGISSGAYRLVFVAPERLLTPRFLSLVQRKQVRAFAIDEAHCISHWGHDFRPEYRRLAALKERFPDASVHAYTATATDRVRQDIIVQLGLRQPRVLVGRFDRPNLVYRIVARGDLVAQVLEAVRRHSSEAVIVYCISRNDTERLAAALQAKGVKAAPYHAGLDAETRTATQGDFAAERIDVVVATVAFGMGIDRSNVRCVIHAALPKSVEQYQQETGRAGRDGLEAECLLLYGQEDAVRWKSLLSRTEAGTPAPEVLAAQLLLLDEMQRFAGAPACRHRALSVYFGQPYEAERCDACDVCLHAPDEMENGTEVARRVLACIRALRGSFGAAYVTEVLTGAGSARIRSLGHAGLPEYGSLKSLPRDTVRNIVFQLIEQGFVERTDGDRPVVRLRGEAAREVLEGNRQVRLLAPADSGLQAAETRQPGAAATDRDLFERLRGLRREIARERGVAAFVVFSDATLLELSRLRPLNLAAFRRVHGVGERKTADLGPRFVAEIVEYCNATGSGGAGRSRRDPPPKPPQPGSLKEQAYSMFDRGRPVEEVARETGRAQSTVAAYLEDYIAERRPASVAPWVTEAVYQAVVEAAESTGSPQLRPVFEALDGRVSYDEIRIVLRHAGLR